MVQHTRGFLAGATNAEQRPPLGLAPTGSRVLLVGADLRWSRTVRTVAHEIGEIVVHAVPSGRAALRRMLDPPPGYTHVLLNPARADGLLPALLGLTCDEPGSGSALLLLGRSAGAPSYACVIPGPTRRAILTALTLGCAMPASLPPSVAALRDALADNRIDTRYQPVAWLANREPAGVEALARLYRVGRGMLAPEHFVSRMEDFGLAAELTRRVVARALADIASPALAPYGLTVALNFPLDVLVAPDALRRLDAEREAAGVAASRVVIELTERRTVADLRQLRRTVSRLREAGYGIAIDDIGPTMPRYEALLDMPFTTIKLDKYVVTRSAVAGDTAEFVKRVIARAKARGLVVVVEGVEDVQTWNRMRRAGADLAQGFVIARPLPAAALPAWKDAWRSRTDLG